MVLAITMAAAGQPTDREIPPQSAEFLAVFGSTSKLIPFFKVFIFKA